ncbi:MAG TPA: hypothetical protein VFV88_02340 [Steroidobacteraceae bacterium]|jgi:hypothetical protein|nr:hypothetical protein [Steroidobacteraceae bacterium]
MRWALPLLALAAAAPAADAPVAVQAPVFVDDFEGHAAGAPPGAPWKEETYRSGAVITVDGAQAWSGTRAMHVFTPRGAPYRRGYMAIHLGKPFPQLQHGMFGRAMVWLDAAPGTTPVHWTLLQGEGRSADDRYNSIYRLGLEEHGGTRFMANFETTPPVRTDCREPSVLTLPVRQWACVEWHFDVASNELEFWLDGRQVVHVRERARAANACRGDDLGGQWRAPPRLDSLYMGFERYGDTPGDQDLWIDDVALSEQRVGCPTSVRRK